MDKLPVEIKVKIVKQLNVKNQIKLRLLNKKWKSFIDDFFGIKNLAVSNQTIRVHDFYGFNNLLECSFIPQQEILDNQYFAKVERLVIKADAGSDCEKLLYQISLLDCLTSLEIKNLSIKRQQIGTEVFCRNLQYLRIGFIYFYDKKIILSFNAPNLTHLKFSSVHEIFNQLTFIHPESLKNLIVFRYVDEILNFENLEYLFFKDSYFYSDPFYATEILTKLKKLKALYLFNSPKMFKNLINKKEEMKITEPKIYYNYVQANDDKDLKKLANTNFFNNFNKRLYYEEFEFLNDNLPNLANTLEIDFFNYCYLDRFYENKGTRIPNEFIDKLQNLTKLKLERVVQLESLFYLLKQCKLIKKITIEEKATLSKEFFNYLPGACPKLEKLKILVIEDMEVDFLLNFQILKILFIRHILSADLIKQLFDRKRTISCSCKILNLKDEKFFRTINSSNIAWLLDER